MPRYRSIQCENCGHYVLKRDTECERCGATTPQEKRKLAAQLYYFGFVALLAIGFMFYVRHVLPDGG